MRSSGIAGSERLKISDDCVAVDFDNAVTLRLLKFDNECQEAQAKRIAYECGKAFFGTGESSESSENETVEIV